MLQLLRIPGYSHELLDDYLQLIDSIHPAMLPKIRDARAVSNFEEEHRHDKIGRYANIAVSGGKPVP